MWANKKNNTNLAVTDKKAQKGFTIVETLIVLAVSSAIFISGALMISGKVQRTQEKTAIDGTGQFLQNVLNDVATGYYPIINSAIKCDKSTGTLTISVTGGERGTSLDCVFAGKEIVFEKNTVKVYTVVADSQKSTTGWTTGQLLRTGEEPQSFTYPYQTTREGATNTTYYILNTMINPKLATDETFNTGAQNVSLYKLNGGAISPVDGTGDTLYFCNGSKKSYITINSGGSSNNILYNVGVNAPCS